MSLKEELVTEKSPRTTAVIYQSIKKVVRSTQLANMNNKKATISESCLEAEEMK